ncbi:toll-like receptor 4, partial [Haliotis rubra]|uniref:toll-like receptor 4 n=1 Tax=Haliotis rubra TaxID=36100 RepID=UPI001EE618A8
LDEGSLKNLPQLSKLDLGRNRINFTLLPTGLFREVYLIGNKIRIIDRGTLIQPPFSQCLRVLDLSHNMILEDTCKNVNFFGLENLQSLEISGNGFTELPTTFMKSFPNIQNLSLNHITQGFREISENIDSVLGHLEHLENLHLLGNGLSDLPRNVENLTNIKLIDVSYNSMKELSVGARTRLDAMAQKKNLSVNLRGNVLSCGCDSLEFILWSMDSKVHFADDKHYMCRNDNRTIIHVTDIADSFMKIWRECISLFSLLFSICLVFLFLLGVSLSLHIARNINLIKRWSVRWLGLDFQRHFKYDVFVYYSSKEDPQWVYMCSTLRQKLEDERELRLCIPERDFEPGVYTCEEVLGAISQSWKTIIYLT